MGAAAGAHPRGPAAGGPAGGRPGPAVYRIRVAGLVEAAWARDLCGMEVVVLPDGRSDLVGAVADQSALLGVLRQLRDKDHTLLSVVLKSSAP